MDWNDTKRRFLTPMCIWGMNITWISKLKSQSLKCGWQKVHLKRVCLSACKIYRSFLILTFMIFYVQCKIRHQGLLRFMRGKIIFYRIWIWTIKFVFGVFVIIRKILYSKIIMVSAFYIKIHLRLKKRKRELKI